MNADTVVQSEAPLQPHYIPENLVGLEDQKASINTIIEESGSGSVQHLFLHGPRGTGKTHLTQHCLESAPTSKTPIYIDCRTTNTQYKALQKIFGTFAREEPAPGYHSSKLKRDIDTHLQSQPAVIVLDEIDFLIMNDGDDLLYTLSRLKARENLRLILISSGTEDPLAQLDPRTQSSLNYQRQVIEPYPADTIYQILQQRAQAALEPRSLRHDALTYIAASAPNAAVAIHWLKETANDATGAITEPVARQTREDAISAYQATLLDRFTDHHERLYHVIKDLVANNGADPLSTGDIYEEYHHQCSKEMVEPLSTRRLSDYLKHLEHLGIIAAEYKYGGSSGKTRHIHLTEIGNVD